MASNQPVDDDREALLCALQQAGVEFVLLGGAGIESYGERYRTKDVDVLPEPSTANLERLATALNGLGCRLVVEPADRSQDVPLPAGYFTAASIARVAIWNLATRHGDLDIVGTPSGFPGGYEQLQGRARPLRVADTTNRGPGRRTRRHRALQTHCRTPERPRLPPQRRPPPRTYRRTRERLGPSRQPNVVPLSLTRRHTARHQSRSASGCPQPGTQRRSDAD